MALNPSPFRLSDKGIDSLTGYAKDILVNHQGNANEFHNKLEHIDYNYFMYKTKIEKDSGTDVVHDDIQVGAIIDEFTIPVVTSQVDSFIGYLAEVYLTGFPLFPIVSNPNVINEAEKLEAIIDRHALLGGYPRQLLKAFRNGVKYNFMPVAVEWDVMSSFEVGSTLLKPTEQAKINRADYSYNKVTSLDAYNTIWDRTVPANAVSAHGEFAGYLEVISRIELKRLIQKYQNQRQVYNIGKSLSSGIKGASPTTSYYREKPSVSNYVTSNRRNKATNWMHWIKGHNPKLKNIDHINLFERAVFYCRIIPSEHLITNVPAPNTPQIWKIDMILPDVIISASRVLTVMDLLPINIAQPLDDDFDLQTHSIAESQIPFQEMSSKLINTRFAGARRAISDRALYDPNMVRASDVNNPTAAPKIPVKIPIGSQKGLGDAYKDIPYRDEATNGIVADAARVLEFSQMLHGQNKATQGQFVKGNKTRAEWDDTMGFTNNRLRIPAISTEYQMMVPLKEHIRLNLYQYGAEGIFTNYRTGHELEVTSEDLEKMRKHDLSFKLADGFTPSAKMISPEALTTGMSMIQSSPILQQAYGEKLPGLFAHMMSLAGVHNLDQYSPTITPGAQPNEQQPATPAGPAQDPNTGTV